MDAVPAANYTCGHRIPSRTHRPAGNRRGTPPADPELAARLGSRIEAHLRQVSVEVARVDGAGAPGRVDPGIGVEHPGAGEVERVEVPDRAALAADPRAVEEQGLDGGGPGQCGGVPVPVVDRR